MRFNVTDYRRILDTITIIINTKYANTDIEKLEYEQLKNDIKNILVQKSITLPGLDTNELAEYLYHEMADLSFISREKLFYQENFEELNINSWDDVDIVINGKTFKTDFSFISPEHAINIHEKMFRKTQVVFDRSMPRAIADIGDNIRICAERYPIVDEDVAVASSIRKVKSGYVDKKELLTWGTATEEMINFLLLCLEHSISVCVSGETGSGKTTLSGALIAIIAQKRRTVTIEEGSREWQFRQKDDNNGWKNSVVHLKTRNSEKDDLNITQETLIKDALRLDPEFLPIGEIRGEEAFEVMGASNTGHTVITTIHSNGTGDTPLRLITLAKKAYDMSDTTLLTMASRAFPILVHIELCPDKIRRITEISEVLGYNGSVVNQRKLYQFICDDTVTDGINKRLINARFERVGNISENLKNKMLKKGASKLDVDAFCFLERRNEYDF